MFDENRHEIGYLQVYSHVRRRDKKTGKWVLVANPAITREFENKKHIGWVSIRDPHLTELIGETPSMFFDEEYWDDNFE